MKKPRLTILALACALLTAVLATDSRADSANNIFRFGAGWVVPNADETVRNGANDVRLEADNAGALYLGYERRLIPWLGLEGQVLYANSQLSATSGSATATSDEKFYLGTLALNIHVFARSRVDLWLGPFIGYTVFDKSFENAAGYGAGLGLDIGLTKSGLALGLAARYTRTDADVKNVPGATVSWDPLIFQVGLGWRF